MEDFCQNVACLFRLEKSTKKLAYLEVIFQFWGILWLMNWWMLLSIEIQEICIPNQGFVCLLWVYLSLCVSVSVHVCLWDWVSVYVIVYEYVCVWVLPRGRWNTGHRLTCQGGWGLYHRMGHLFNAPCWVGARTLSCFVCLLFMFHHFDSTQTVAVFPIVHTTICYGRKGVVFDELLVFNFYGHNYCESADIFSD